MKPILINFTDENAQVVKTYSTCSIKTGTMDNIFEIAERAENLEQVKDMKVIREFYLFLKATIVEVFANQFTYDELNKGVEQGELMKVFSSLCENLKGSMAKK